MRSLISPSSEMAQWYELVLEAEAQREILLAEDLESYLVFLLIRFTDKPHIANSVLALEFLQGAQLRGEEQHDRLRDVGDQCLLFTGFFPKLAEKRLVNIDYFVQLGQTAYHSLTALPERQWRGPYAALSMDFLHLTSILSAMRGISNPTEKEQLLLQFDLKNFTGRMC